MKMRKQKSKKKKFSLKSCSSWWWYTNWAFHFHSIFYFHRGIFFFFFTKWFPFECRFVGRRYLRKDLLMEFWARFVVYMLSPVQLFPNLMDSSPQGSSMGFPWTFQTRVLVWVAISFFRGSPWTQVSCTGTRILCHRATSIPNPSKGIIIFHVLFMFSFICNFPLGSLEPKEFYWCRHCSHATKENRESAGRPWSL